MDPKKIPACGDIKGKLARVPGKVDAVVKKHRETDLTDIHSAILKQDVDSMLTKFPLEFTLVRKQNLYCVHGESMVMEDGRKAGLILHSPGRLQSEKNGMAYPARFKELIANGGKISFGEAGFERTELVKSPWGRCKVFQEGGECRADLGGRQAVSDSYTLFLVNVFFRVVGCDNLQDASRYYPSGLAREENRDASDGEGENLEGKDANNAGKSNGSKTAQVEGGQKPTGQCIEETPSVRPRRRKPQRAGR